MTEQYTPAQLTETEQITARMGAASLVRKIGTSRLENPFINLAVENVRLVKEINQLRRQIGIPPVEEHKVA